MKTSITKIGNSKGVIIPAKLMREVGIGDEVNMEVTNGSIIMTPIGNRRQGWAESFKEAPLSNDELLLDEMSTHFDEEEWTW